jgi:hypothetical protein
MHFYACVYTLVRQVSSVRARMGSLLQPGAHDGCLMHPTTY